ncbi:two-partner secretion domain-containing protein, partial [Citrobacter sp. Awk 4]|uniref:two-partner secretion domain-containing protein n=1 Tax=Citrobacter sp. Awk 4 TaxID=2963955 RepID=UPI003FA4997B
MEKDQVRFSQRAISVLLSVLLTTQPLFPAIAATITPTGNTQMDKAPNGVPVVNIAAPNQSGISHNKYNDYNVGKEGLILNNATGQFNQTQLGGIVQNNPNLQPGKQATGIINEVIGTNRSQLQGYTEVAGKAANVIVANPYGITCNGCGFINTPNVTLTTGKPVLDANGNLQSLEVRKGGITIEGKGLDGSQSDAVSIISRATEINAQLHAKDLSVITGANRVAANGQISSLKGEGVAPKVAVDTSALGGMYANRIRLVSSEKGLGVNLGNLNARQGDITLDASGKLTVKSSLASGALSARGDGVSLTGSHKTGGRMDISSSGALALQEANLSSGAAVRLASDGNMTLRGGGITATDELKVAAKQDATITGATLVSQNTASLGSDGTLTISDGSLTSKKQLDVTGTHGLTLARTTLGSNADVALSSKGRLSASGSAISANNGLALKAQQVALDNSSRADAGRSLNLNAGDINNQGQVNAGGYLTLSGSHVVNGGTVAAKGRLDASVSNIESNGVLQGNGVSVSSESLVNRGTLASGGALAVKAKTLIQQGTLSSMADANIQADDTLRNEGRLLANGTLAVRGGVVEQNGVLSGERALTVNAVNLSAAKDSLTTGQGDVQINVDQNVSLNGQFNAGGALSVKGKQLTTDADSHLQSAKNLAISAENVTLDGVQAAKGALSVTAQTLSHGGKSTGASIDFHAGKSADNHGELQADTLALSGAKITHSGIAKADRISLLAPELITSSGSLIADTLTLQSQHIVNSGLMQGNETLALNTSTLDNLAKGTLYSAHDLTLNIPQFSNRGLVTTGGNLRLTGDRLSNAGEINGVNLNGHYAMLTSDAGGRLLADNLMTLTGDALDNSGLIAADGVLLTVGALKNQGNIQGSTNLTLTADDTVNGGVLHSGHALSLDGAILTNNGELSATTLLLTLSGKLDNGIDGNVIADEGLEVTTPELVNSGLLTGNTLRLQGRAVSNSGTLQGFSLLTATGDSLVNQTNGKLLTAGTLELNNRSLINAGLLQGKTLNLATGEWINTGNVLGEAGLTAHVSGVFTSQGKALSQQNMDIHAARITNSGTLMAKVLTLHGDLQSSGILQGSQALSWDGDGFTNQAGGQVVSTETLALTGKKLENQGQMESRAVTLKTDTLRNGGGIQAQDSLRATVAGKLENQGAFLSQGLFELAAAQVINDGQLAANTLTLNIPQLTNNGLLQGNSALQLTTRDVINGKSGQMLSGTGLALDLSSLENHGLVLANGRFTLAGDRFSSDGEIHADTLGFTLTDSLNNQGKLVAKHTASFDANRFENHGQLAAQNITLEGKSLHNSGLVQGNDSVSVTADTLTTVATGKWLTGNALTVNAGSVSHDGVMQGDTIALTANALNNRGVLNGQHGLKGTLTGQLTNQGQIQSGSALSLTADDLNSTGRIAGNTLTLFATTLSNGGLWQGTNGLTLTGDTLTTGAGSRTLSGGVLTLNAGNMATQGTLQGQQVLVATDDWQHNGSLVSLGEFTANISNSLTNPGELMSQGAMSLTAPQLDNSGKILSESNVTLDGQRLNNGGAVQGNTLTVHQNRINNQGTLTGLQSLTLEARQRLMARMAMTTPSQELINGSGGSLLTQGTLKVTSGDVTNAGTWQGQSVLLSAQSLTNYGAIQSADVLQLILANNLTSGAGSKITALGNATLQALSLTNNGQWAAKNLTLKGTTLDNTGAASGVNGLTLTMNSAVSQRKSGSMLTGGALNLNSASVANEGKIQGATLGITSGALTNSGRLQGDNGATLSLSGALTNNAGGEIVSRQGLTVTTPVMSNYGLIQGGGDTRFNATTRALNEGKLLSGAGLTLTTPQYSGAGWLQATQLILNATTATNSGNWLADSATLTGNNFTNLGTTQAGQLAVNYNQLTNNGTLLGNARLTVNADQVNQNAAGKLFSGGDLSLESKGLTALGQVVALGNLTLKLANAFTANSAFAAGKTLSVTSDSAIDNRSVLQGQAVNLSAGGQLSNNGKITTGSGASALSGSSVAFNAAGTVQGGGDITVSSRGNITVDGFTGTRGTLTLSAPGAIINRALLYAANNLALYANSITNQRGDILAGNSLWMQKDAAGNANSEVINTSGTIETQNGDITIKTGHLLNQRDGLNANQTQIAGSNNIPGVGGATLDVDISQLPEGSYGVNGYSYERQASSCSANASCNFNHYFQYYYAPFEDSATQKFISSQIKTDVTSSGGASRIASGRNLTMHADSLDNLASNILANNNINLSGNTLNNQSWQSGTLTDYFVYKYSPEQYSRKKFAVDSVDVLPPRYNEGRTSNGETILLPKETTITFTLEGHDRAQENGDIYRSVIQAGGNVAANFSTAIGNETTSSNAGGVVNTLLTPTLNTLSHQGISGGVQKQTLAGGEAVSINSVQWNDQLQNALQHINGGGTLDSASVANTALDSISVTEKNNASLGQLNGLSGADITDASLNTTQGRESGHYQGKTADTSAYPLPSGNNGYFVVSDNPKSPYLISVNPKLNGMGQLDPNLFGDLNALLGIKPGAAPRETNSAYTDQNKFLGSAYMLDRLKLNPEYDYRFLGDAAFDTRYVSNAMLNQTGSRYINGIGSDLEQMRYLMDNAASAQRSLGLKFGVAMTAEQIATLEQSMMWWEAATINGETVMIPKLYLSPKDVTVNNGSVISGNNVQLAGGNIINSGSSILAKNNLTLDSQNSINNLNNGLIQAGGNLDLSAIGDINNISSAISGKTVALESLDGSINNLTLAEQIDITAQSKYSTVSFKDTLLGTTSSITAQDGLSLSAGKDITVTGANLAAGGSLLMEAWGDIAVNANQINDAQGRSGRWVADTRRSSVDWQGSSISAGGNLGIIAGNNLNVTASDVKAGGNAQLAAGNDLNLNAASTRENNRNGGSESHSSGLDRTTVSAGDSLVLKAGQDINAHAAGLAAEGNVGIQAGRDVNLQAGETVTGSSSHAKKKTVINESVRQQGTEIASSGNTTIIAGRDVNSEAAQVTASGDIGVAAGRDVNLTTATESDYHYQDKTKTKKGLLSKKTTHTIEEDSATREAGTLLSGDNVTVQAGNNLLVKGSSVVGDNTVALGAGNNVDIVAATNTDTSWRFKETKKSGLMGTGGIGITVGSSKSTHDLREAGTTQSQSFSTVGSTGGNVVIAAGNQAHIGGADLIAGKDMSLSGSSVLIDPGHDKRTRDETFEQKKSGLTLALSGTVGSAINNAVTAAQDTKEESDGRLKALQATKTVLSGVQAGQAAEAANLTADPNAMGVSLSLTTQKSKSQQHAESDAVAGSTLNAGNNLSITANGKKGDGDIVIAGSQLKAGGDTLLDAKNDVILSGAANTRQSSGKNSSSGGGVGVSIG